MSQFKVYHWADVAWDIATERGMNENSISRAVSADSKNEVVSEPIVETATIPVESKDLVRNPWTGLVPKKKKAVSKERQHAGVRTQEVTQTGLSTKLLMAIMEGKLQGRSFEGTPTTPPNGSRFKDVFVYPPDVKAWLKDEGYLLEWHPEQRERQVDNATRSTLKQRAVGFADQIALERYTRGDKGITARNISNEVANRLNKDKSNYGNRGERSADGIRTQCLKGWKFNPPSGMSGTKNNS
jgi:hypothetical protein